MFKRFFDQKAKLERKYQQLLKESYELSHSDRKLSDLKTAQAQEVKEQLEAIETKR